MNDKNECCNPVDDCCTPSRRTFLQATTLTALAAAPAGNAIAGPFEVAAEGFEHRIPADKKLSQEWIDSLYDRGEPELYSGWDKLKHVGMPVGGVCCGQLYLNGDGRLWVWDIFQNLTDEKKPRGAHVGPNYEQPGTPSQPNQHQAFDVEHGFAIQVAGDQKVRTFDKEGFSDVSFRGEYPVGKVTYKDADCPVEARLEAFSPFIPTDADNSGIPATVMSFTLNNTSDKQVAATMMGWLQNKVCPTFDDPALGFRVNRLVKRPGRTTISMECRPGEKQPGLREDILFAAFEGDSYEGWRVEGDAFGDAPYKRGDMPGYHGVTRHVGEGSANSHNARLRDTISGADALLGKLTSKPFAIERKFITFRISGGNFRGKTCLNLVVDGKVVKSATGRRSNQMSSARFDVSDLQGQQAHIEIVDAQQGGWGHVGVDHIVFTDQKYEFDSIEELPGYGSMALSLLGEASHRVNVGSTKGDLNKLSTSLRMHEEIPAIRDETDFGSFPVGALGRVVSLDPGESVTVEFLISWYFPYFRPLRGGFSTITGIEDLARHYENKFSGASGVAGYVVGNKEELLGKTRLWNKTWYDSTLPYWFLDRTFIPTCNLATQTCFWLDNDRFWAWEGVYCCSGTCTHVWNYAQCVARVFPQLERTTREMVDFDIALREDGMIGHRSEAIMAPAIDGQLGVILRAYREHSNSADDAFLKRCWPGIKLAMQYIIATDPDSEGLLRGDQHNTLDQSWTGPMGWISSMYVAALQACEAMATEAGDGSFASQCAEIAAAGRKNLVDVVYNGEFFIHLPADEVHASSNSGCLIDQLFGESLAVQTGLPKVVGDDQAESALRAIWKYNFTLDAGGYRNQMQQAIKGGRWYAMPGEAGVVMCTWPDGDDGAKQATGKRGNPGFVQYFNECWTGQEYQVAAHMMYQGKPESDLVQDALAITRVVHERHLPELRNPYNEIECSDHYARAMASYGVFLGACGFAYHGPKGKITFAPRLSPERFKAPFTVAEGWGTYTQEQAAGGLDAEITLKHGHLHLSQVSLQLPGDLGDKHVQSVTVNGIPQAEVSQEGADVRITLDDQAQMFEGDSLKIVVRV